MEFIPYTQALELKQLDFNEPCFGYYKHTTIPNKIISNDLIIGFIKDNRIYNDVSNGSSLVGLGKGFIFAPTFSQAFKFIREKYNLIGLVEGGYDNGKNIFTYVIWEGFKDIITDDYFETYKEAELNCLNELIKMVKENGK